MASFPVFGSEWKGLSPALCSPAIYQQILGPHQRHKCCERGVLSACLLAESGYYLTVNDKRSPLTYNRKAATPVQRASQQMVEPLKQQMGSLPAVSLSFSLPLPLSPSPAPFRLTALPARQCLSSAPRDVARSKRIVGPGKCQSQETAPWKSQLTH